MAERVARMVLHGSPFRAGRFGRAGPKRRGLGYYGLEYYGLGTTGLGTAALGATGLGITALGATALGAGGLLRPVMSHDLFQVLVLFLKFFDLPVFLYNVEGEVFDLFKHGGLGAAEIETIFFDAIRGGKIRQVCIGFDVI